jgi:hypothetical protein
VNDLGCRQAVEKIVDRSIAQTPTLTVIQHSKEVVGKLSEKEKGLTTKNG